MRGLEHIRIQGARVHNLKNITLTLPRNQLVVLTGLSGSGKSSLAFDTIYAEGQRRYVESLSSYARQFLEMQDKPDVDLIEGLSPAISIEQKTTSKNPRSTVGTVTEIYDYLRLLFARIGKPHCYQCQKPILGRSPSQIIDDILSTQTNKTITLLSPVVRERKGEYKKELDQYRKNGFTRVRIDGHMRHLEEDIVLNPKQKHSIDLVIDRLEVMDKNKTRLSDGVELALREGAGLMSVLLHEKEEKELLFSEHFRCVDCGISYNEIEPRLFSFNNPKGACSTCSGLGMEMGFSEQRIIENPKLSLAEGPFTPWSGPMGGFYYTLLRRMCKAEKIPFDVPFENLKKDQQKKVLYEGGKGFEGVITNLTRRYKETQSDGVREELERFMFSKPCTSCQGKRLKPEALHIWINQKSIAHVVGLSLAKAKTFFDELVLNEKDALIAKAVLKEITSRFNFLLSVGLDYLTLDRASGTLSGGEAQRIRLATQIGSALVGVLYVLDEPSIGLHQRDNERLLSTLKHLRDLGNTVLVVEHDEDTILAADHVVDMGPLAGRLGGEVVAQGTPKEVMNNTKSLTADYLTGRKSIQVPKKRRTGNGTFLKLLGARGNNLKNVTLSIPLGTLMCVTGVSGSGKSTLVVDTLKKALSQHFFNAQETPLPYDKIEGLKHIDKVIDIDQSPIGRTPRSNPVTYIGVFDPIRQLFAQMPESKLRGYEAGRFSFNVKGGRCETCSGGGVIQIEMNFLPDVYVICDACRGKRFNQETLEIVYKNKSIADVLDMTVEEACEFFAAVPTIFRKLETLKRVGLGYIHLGQQATTLSGGEAQRVKLAKELSKRSTGKTLYILDEPTTGLHFHDVKQLLEVLQELVEQKNTVLVIEHNLDVIKVADHVVDMGPEGGDLGGEVLIQGTPEAIAKYAKSHTGRFLKTVLNREHAS